MRNHSEKSQHAVLIFLPLGFSIIGSIYMLTQKLVWYGLGSTTWTLLLLATLLVSLWAIVSLYKLERKLVSPKTGILLVSIRITVLALLILLLFEPVVTWTVDHSHQGKILIALDVSDSMKTADLHASNAEKLRWAQALRMVGKKGNDERIARWIASYEKNEEPLWISEQEIPDLEERRQRTATIKQNVEGLLKRVEQMTRREIAISLLLDSDQAIIESLSKISDLELVTFAGDLNKTDRKQLLTFADSSTAASQKGGVSNLELPLGHSSSSAEISQSIRAIVLLTDGRDTTTSPKAISVASQLGQLERPVYPIPFGSIQRPIDLSIDYLGYPVSVFKKDVALVQVDISTNGFEGTPVEVTLKEDDGTVIKKTTVTPTQNKHHLEFQIESKKKGRHQYHVTITHQEKETRDDNNERTFSINTTDNSLRVLLVEGEGRWEFRYLQAALARDAGVDLSTVVFDQPFLGVLPDTFFPRKLPRATQSKVNLPEKEVKPTRFADFELVILGDVSSQKVPESIWKELEQYVSNEGGTLFLEAGKNFLPLAHSSETLDRILPVTNLREVQLTGKSTTLSPTERGFHLKLSSEASELAIFQFSPDTKENEAIWKELPGHLWGLAGEPKPGTEVWATGQFPANWKDRLAEKQNAMIVRRKLGYGEVVWMGVDSTWRWRHRVGDVYHDRFWGQLARWAASRKGADGNQFVRFGVKSPTIFSGEDALFEAQWSREFLEANPKVKASVEISLKRKGMSNKLISTIPLKSLPNHPVLFNGRAINLPVGEYQLKLIVEGIQQNQQQQMEPLKADLFVNEPQTAEYSNLTLNYEFLQQIANQSKGKIVLPENAHKLQELLATEKITESEIKEQSLWDHWLPLCGIMLLMMVEWCTRKLNGLP